MKNPPRSMLQCIALEHHHHRRHRTILGQATDPIIRRQDTSMGPKTPQRPRSPHTPPRPAHNIAWTAKHNDNRTTPPPDAAHATQRHQSAPPGNQHQGRIPLRHTATNHLHLHGSLTWPTRRSPTVTQEREMMKKKTWTQLSPCRPTCRPRNRYKNQSLRPLLLPSKNLSKPPYRKHNALPAKNIKGNLHK